MCRLASPLPIWPSLSSCSPTACLACAEMCELSELSELSHRDTLGFSPGFKTPRLKPEGNSPTRAARLESRAPPHECGGSHHAIWTSLKRAKSLFICRLPVLCRMGGGFCSGILTGLPCGVVRWCISKLSKLLHQENALGAPFSGCDFCSPQALPGAQECCGQA